MNNLSPPLKPFNIKTANSESNDLPSYLKSAVYPSYSNSTIISKLPEKKYFPEQSYGISYESPTYFRAKHTLINKNSYKNPYITNPVDYDFTTFTEHGKMENLKKSPQNKLSYTQTFKIGEDPKFFDSKALETTKLPALKTYNCILDQNNQIKERDLIVQENSSFVEEFHKMNQIPHSFHMKQGMFGDFVERNNIMNVFGPLAKTERSEVFFDRSREFTSTQKSIDKTLKSNKRNMSNGEILKNVSKENSLEGLSSVLSKPQIDLQASSNGNILVQNGSSANISNLKSFYKKRIKLSELKPIPFSLTKYLRKIKENSMRYQADIERFYQNDQKYINSINNSIMRTKIFEAVQRKQFQKDSVSYSNSKEHVPYKEFNMDLEKFEGVSKFYKFLQPLSKRELEKRYKVKEKRKNCLQIKEEKTEESSAYNFQSQINII